MSDLSADRLTEVCGSQSATRSFLMVPSLSFIVLRTLMRAQPHRITRNVLLPRPGYAQGTNRNILGNDGTRSDGYIITYLHRCDKHRVRTGVDLLSNYGAVLLTSIIVGCDVTRTDIGPSAYLRISNVT